MKQKLLLILFVFMTLASCRKKTNVWTKEYEAKEYAEIDKGLTPVFTVDTERKKYSDYIIKRFKVALPYGIESVSDDSVRILMTRFFKECPFSIANSRATVLWTPGSEASFKESFLSKSAIKFSSKDAGSQYCDCLLSHLKQMYPNGMQLPVADSIFIKAAGGCKVK